MYDLEGSNDATFRVGFSTKCAGILALPFLVLFSLSLMNTIWSNTAGDYYAQTLSDARISPRMFGARTFHE